MSAAPADLDAAADELYSLSPQQFTQRRDDLARSARSSGDRELAVAIKDLRRPTVAAWLVNLAVRADVTELQDLLDVGEQLRQAQAAMAAQQLRELTARRQELERLVVRRITSLAGQDGQAISPQAAVEVEETLRAATADPRAADAVGSGRLTRALSYAGFGEVDVEAATATPLGRAPRRRPSPDDELAPRRRARQERPAEREPEPAPAAARQRDKQAESRRRELRDAVQAARRRSREGEKQRDATHKTEQALRQRVEQLHEQLQEARAKLADATKAAAQAAREDDRARRALATAERDLERGQS